MTKEEANKMLKPFSAVIQKCPRCGQLDVVKDDNHDCNPQAVYEREMNQQQYYD